MHFLVLVDLEIEIKAVWNRTVDVIKDGVQTWKVGNRTFNNLPAPSYNKVAHVRPHAKNKSDTYPLPQGGELTKQCFWLNNSYILNEISKE